ncbi:MAG: hypothetical protein PHD21_08505 [Flavobacteriales bacterium]|nr:hypothetical protein [Flavobacteriales bacterium]
MKKIILLSVLLAMPMFTFAQNAPQAKAKPSKEMHKKGEKPSGHKEKCCKEYGDKKCDTLKHKSQYPDSMRMKKAKYMEKMK